MDLLSKINKENIYKTIYDIEGEKQPYLSPDALNECADYLENKMKSYGLNVRTQEFKLDSSDMVFRNIEGSIGDVENKPAAVLTAHYDTVPTSPGGNDDAVGVATMLEIARVLSQMDNPPPVYFVAVTLEENNNPKYFEPAYKSLVSLGIKDENYFFTSWKLKKDYALISNHAEGMFQQGADYGSGYKAALEAYGSVIDGRIKQHFEEILPLYEGLDATKTLGELNRIGSYKWLTEALEQGKPIAFNITLDEMGVFMEDELTQRDLAGINLYEMMKDKHNIDAEKRIGNFLAVSSNAISMELADKLAAKMKDPQIDMPYGRLHIPMTFDQLTKMMPMALNSDHAGFWKHDIPAVFLFDTANARNPYGHSHGDTIDILNFDMIEKVAKGALLTLTDEEILER